MDYSASLERGTGEPCCAFTLRSISRVLWKVDWGRNILSLLRLGEGALIARLDLGHGAMIWFVIAARSLLGVSPTSGKETYEATVEQNVAAEMRDGIALRAGVYRPNAEGNSLFLLCVRPAAGRVRTVNSVLPRRDGAAL